MRIVLGLAVVCVAGLASASPTVPLDEPVYDQLAILRAEGRLPLYAGGIQPLTEWDAQRLLLQAGAAPDPALQPFTIRGFWFTPARRTDVRFGIAHDEERDFDQPVRPAQVLGGVEVSCERQEGRPCGQGGGGMIELDSAVGYGRWVSAFTRLQLMSGSNEWSTRGALDRAYINGEYGPVAAEIGRDVLALGPGVHTQLIWSNNSAPFDHVRLQTAHPLKIPRLPVTVSGLFAFGLLRDPQTFHDTQVSLTRLSIALFDQFEIGVQQLLQLNGDGAIHYGFVQFWEEQFTRTGHYPGAGGSNRRDSGELVYTARRLRGLRIYYEIAFEDFKKELGDFFKYDCDHLGGIEMPALTKDGRYGFVVELQHNGAFSQEHSYFTSGLTNAGRVVGAPLGPDSWSLYGSFRVDLPRRIALWPWFEWARLSGNDYNAIVYGPIVTTATHPAETRERIGARARILLPRELRVEVQALYEHVDTYAFVVGQRRNNVDFTALLSWTPRLPPQR